MTDLHVETDFTPRSLDYNFKKYRFDTIVKRMLQVDDLSALFAGNFGVEDRLTRETDQKTVLHQRFYTAFADELADTYRTFVAEMAERVFPGERIYYQTTPTFRVHFPDNVAVGEFHCDSDYHHQNGAINVWVPLTNAKNTSAVWIERSLGSNEFRPWNIQPGQVLVFDGVNWRHGNIANFTGKSRVSFDLRLLPADRYVDTGYTTVNAGRRLALGDYYSEL